MDFLQTLFNGKSLTFDELKAAVEAAGNGEDGKPLYNLANLADGGYVSKDKHDKLERERDGLKLQLEQRDKDLAELKKDAKDDKELQKKYDALKAAYDKDTQDLKKDLEQMSYDHAVEKALLSSSALNTKAVRALLDESKISLKNGKLEGLDEQIATLQKEKDSAFLFKSQNEEKPGFHYTPKGSDGTPPTTPDTTHAAIAEHYQNETN